MFTGIIETKGRIKSLVQEGSNLRLIIESSISNELKIDQSVAHNGVCLTVEKVEEGQHEVVAVKETINKSNLGELAQNSFVNLERCMKLNDLLDGHIVQGHVDDTAKVERVLKEEGSWVFKFQLNNPSKLIVEKGSICINGVSLTAFNVTDTEFEVTIIPYTFEHTGFKQLREGDKVNIEYDIIGKYVSRLYNN
jgi:riboflavin synthase